MQKKYKILISILVPLLVIALAVSEHFIAKSIIGADDDPDEQNDKPFSISDSTLELDFGEAYTLKAYRGNDVVVADWSVTGDAVTVHSGVVRGIKAGEAVVTATHNGSSLSCTVVVKGTDSVSAGSIPNLRFGADDLELIQGDEFVLTPTLSLNGEDKLMEAVLKYEVSDTSVLRLTANENNSVTIEALKETTAPVTVTVTCKWGSSVLSDTISVKVKDDVLIVMEKSAVELVAYPYSGFVSTATLNVASVIDHGTVVSSPNVTWSVADSTIASINENGVVNALLSGETVAIATWTDADGKAHTGYCGIIVSETVFDCTDKEVVWDISAQTNTVELSDLGLNISDATFTAFDTVAEKSIAVSCEGGVLTLSSKDIIAGNRSVELRVNRELVIKINPLAVTKVIRTADEFMSLVGHFGSGYYVLGADIDLGDRVVSATENNQKKLNEIETFTGTFDGQGYTISGGKYHYAGIFGTVGKKGTIKRVAFENAIVEVEDWTTGNDLGYGQCAIIASDFGGTLEDVLIDMTGHINTGNFGGVFGENVVAGAKLKNLVIYSNGGFSDVRSSLVQNASEDIKVENVFAFSFAKSDGTPAMIAHPTLAASIANNATINVLSVTLSETNIKECGFDTTLWNLTGDKAEFQPK